MTTNCPSGRRNRSQQIDRALAAEESASSARSIILAHRYRGVRRGAIAQVPGGGPAGTAGQPPIAADRADVGGVRQPFTEGSIDAQPVPCLSAELQLLLHNGYPQRETDNHDVALLRAYLDLPEGMTTA